MWPRHRSGYTYDISTWLTVLLGIAALVKIGVIIARHLSAGCINPSASVSASCGEAADAETSGSRKFTYAATSGYYEPARRSGVL
jgi:hypothetical protein